MATLQQHSPQRHSSVSRNYVVPFIILIILLSQPGPTDSTNKMAEEQVLDAARHEISECEKEITIIKSALRSVSNAAAASTSSDHDDNAPNILKVELQKVTKKMYSLLYTVFSTINGMINITKNEYIPLIPLLCFVLSDRRIAGNSTTENHGGYFVSH
jgi:hypothetical protein